MGIYTLQNHLDFLPPTQFEHPPLDFPLQFTNTPRIAPPSIKKRPAVEETTMQAVLAPLNPALGTNPPYCVPK
jgi:hypothetical protein